MGRRTMERSLKKDGESSTTHNGRGRKPAPPKSEKEGGKHHPEGEGVWTSAGPGQCLCWSFPGPSDPWCFGPFQALLGPRPSWALPQVSLALCWEPLFVPFLSFLPILFVAMLFALPVRWKKHHWVDIRTDLLQRTNARSGNPHTGRPVLRLSFNGCTRARRGGRSPSSEVSMQRVRRGQGQHSPWRDEGKWRVGDGRGGWTLSVHST